MDINFVIQYNFEHKRIGKYGVYIMMSCVVFCLANLGKYTYCDYQLPKLAVRG